MSVSESLGPDRLAFSPEETARVLGMSRAGIYNLIKNGTIPSINLGRRRLIARDTLVGILAGNQR